MKTNANSKPFRSRVNRVVPFVTEIRALRDIGRQHSSKRASIGYRSR